MSSNRWIKRGINDRAYFKKTYLQFYFSTLQFIIKVDDRFFNKFNCLLFVLLLARSFDSRRIESIRSETLGKRLGSKTIRNGIRFAEQRPSPGSAATTEVFESKEGVTSSKTRSVARFALPILLRVDFARPNIIP